jgi:hypothetical protein
VALDDGHIPTKDRNIGNISVGQNYYFEIKELIS